MATSNKKPSANVASDKKRAAVPAEAPMSRSQKPMAAVEPATIETSQARRPSAEEASPPAKPRRGAIAPTRQAASLRGTGSLDASGSATAQAARQAGQAQGERPTHEQIAERAYHIFLARGGRHGHHDDDWQQAERELRSHE